MSDDYKSGIDIAEVEERFYQNNRTAQTHDSSMKGVSTIRTGIGTGMVKEFQISVSFSR